MCYLMHVRCCGSEWEDKASKLGSRFDIQAVAKEVNQVMLTCVRLHRGSLCARYFGMCAQAR